MQKLLLVFSLLFVGNLAAASTSSNDSPAVAAPSAAYVNSYTQVTAHRGNSGAAPENTLGSILRAIQDGAGYSELDVQETSDGVVVLMHDYNARRTTGINKFMWEIDSQQLMNASAGSWFSKAYAAEKVPTLEQVILAVKGKMRLNIELKNNGHQKQLAERTVRLLEQTDFVKDCTVTSFDLSLLQKVKQLNKEIKTGLIVGEKKADFTNMFNNDAFEVISIAYPLIDEPFMRTAADHHKEVYAWTVNDKAVMEKMLDYGVTSIITNVPDQLIPIINKRQETPAKPETSL